MICVGVDPGKLGGIVSIDPGGKILSSRVMPVLTSTKRRSELDLVELRAVVQRLRDLGGIFVVEKGQPMPPKFGGGIANFNRGYGMGLWEAFGIALGLRLNIVAPRRWQALLLDGISARDTKQAALIAARRLWPEQDWRGTEKSRKAHDGLVDAALLAEYGRRRFL